MKKLIFILILFAGCYTVIKHPDVNEDLGYQYKSDCASCHSAFDISYLYEPLPSHVSSPWVYYNIPWWIEWLRDDSSQVNVGASSTEKVRNFGEHRAGNETSFSPPPPTRTSTFAKDSTTSSKERGNNSVRISKDSAGANPSNENAKSQENRQNGKRERNIGQRRK